MQLPKVVSGTASEEPLRRVVAMKRLRKLVRMVMLTLNRNSTRIATIP